MTGWNLPPGCTTADIDRAAGIDDSPGECAISDDEMEARTLKYTRTLSIVPLSSGKYALFLPFSNEEGKPLAFIGEWAELEKPLRDYREPERAATPRKIAAINLDELFGDPS